jgi:hypothetical protein
LLSPITHRHTIKSTRYSIFHLSLQPTAIMKFIIAALALAASVVASPHYGNKGGNGGNGNNPPPPPPAGCTPATYSCLSNASGWQVCSTAGQWVVSFS